MTLDPEILDFYDVEVVQRIIDKYAYDEKEAYSLFLNSKTYRMLANPETGMCQFGPDGIFDIWECEKVTGTPQTSAYMRMV